MAVPQNKQELYARALAELAERKKEALHLFRPSPYAIKYFGNESAKRRIIRGGNRSGKSTHVAADFASAATGIPLQGPDIKPGEYDDFFKPTDFSKQELDLWKKYAGKQLPFRYPKDRPLLMWLFGWDEKHIGKTLYRLLFQPGLFKIIKDQDTGFWRSYSPWLPEDLARSDETVPSPPLIPGRHIDNFAWENKGMRSFTVCRMQTRKDFPEYMQKEKQGTELWAFSSKGEAPQGDPADVIWVNEDIMYPKHIGEMLSRLPDREGNFMWDAFPHSANEALMNMSDRAEKHVNDKAPPVTEVCLSFENNPYFPPKAKKQMLLDWEELGELEARNLGHYQMDAVRVYPTFNADWHGIRDLEHYEKHPANKDLPDYKVIMTMAANHGRPPNDWTRYFVLDPGHTQAGLLFGAIPPPEFGDYLVWYNEVYPSGWDAFRIAQKVYELEAGQVFFKFIIDQHYGRATHGNYHTSIARHQANAFQHYGLESETTGNSFAWGTDDVPGRISLVRDMLRIRDCGTARLKVYLPNVINGQREFKLYKKRVVADVTQDKPVAKNNDLMNCLEYWAGSAPHYSKPKKASIRYSPAHREFLRDKAELGKLEDGSFHCGPGAAEDATHEDTGNLRFRGVPDLTG